MGLETATYISELNAANPTGPSDVVAQGDDHIRMIKRTMQATFPNADRAIYFAQMQTITTSYTAIASDAGSLFLVDATAGAVTITLPAIVDSEGFILGIKKIDSGTNAVTIDGAGAETIDGQTTHTLVAQWDILWLWCDGTAWYIVDRMIEDDRAAPRGYLWGMTLAYSSATAITIAAGECRSSDDTTNMSISSTYTKQLDNIWGVGTPAGMRDTGSITDNWWYVYAIKRMDTGVTDIIASINPTTPTLPTNYTKYRRIGAFLRDASAIVAWQQYGDEFVITRYLAYNNFNPGTSVVSVTMRAPVLPGIIIHGSVYLETNTATYGLITSALLTDSAPVGNLHSFSTDNGNSIGFNTTPFDQLSSNGAVRFRLSASNVNVTVKVFSSGWTDTRGRDR